MARDKSKAVLERHQAALNRHDVEALASLYAEDAILESPMFSQIRGRLAIRGSFDRLFQIFPDYRVEISEALFLADGDRAAEFGTVSATHAVELFGLPPTGRSIHYHSARLFTIRDGLIAYEQRIYDFRGVLERLEKSRMEAEMAMASAVQHALCSTRHTGTFFEAVGDSLPCRAIGGDFLEYLTLPDGRLGLAVGDVAGKGPAAALVAAMLQGMFSMAAIDGRDPSATLGHLNAGIFSRGIEPRFATLAYGALAADGVFTYSNAGHTPPLLLDRNGVTRLTEGGPMLGVFEDAVFPEASVRLAPGDMLVAFSDGVTDAVAPDGRDFGMDRVLATAAAGRRHAPQTLLEELIRTVRTFCGDAPPSDDVTVAVVRYTP